MHLNLKRFGYITTRRVKSSAIITKPYLQFAGYTPGLPSILEAASSIEAAILIREQTMAVPQKEKLVSVFASQWDTALAGIKKVFFVAIIILVPVLIALYLYFNNRIITNGDPSLFPGRDFQRIPFDILDASTVCRAESKAQFGPALLRTQVDDHSTRFQADRGIFIVIMRGYIAAEKGYEEAAIYCYVNPDDHMITYYQAVFSEQQPLLSRALHFFEKQ